MHNEAMTIALGKSVFQFRLASHEYNEYKLNDAKRFTVPTWDNIKGGC